MGRKYLIGVATAKSAENTRANHAVNRIHGKTFQRISALGVMIKRRISFINTSTSGDDENKRRYEMITVDNVQYFKREELQLDISAPKGDRAHTFLELGKVYAFRTVTMIYTGRLRAVSEQEFLVDDACWIPETERFMDFAATGAHKEAEPYKNPITINRGAMLDATEIPSVIRKQK